MSWQNELVSNAKPHRGGMLVENHGCDESQAPSGLWPAWTKIGYQHASPLGFEFTNLSLAKYN